MRIAGKVAIVTGGCQGIGKGIVYALLRKSAKVAFLDIDDSKGATLEASVIQEFGEGRAVYKSCDVTNRNKLKETFFGVKEEFGGLNIIVNNAGIGAPDQFEKVVDINLTSLIHGTMLGIELMDKNTGNNGGAIINMGSVSAFYPLSDLAVYSATKAAVVNYTRALKPIAKACGIQVNCICPSFVGGTDMVEAGIALVPIFKELTDRYGLITVEMVGDAVVKTIEDDQMAGAAVVVNRASPEGCVFEFPKVKL